VAGFAFVEFFFAFCGIGGKGGRGQNEQGCGNHWQFHKAILFGRV
jgi:hypothetical protein